MKRIALMVTCLALMLAIPAGGDEAATERTMLVVETTWIDLHDTSLLPEPVVNEDIGAPSMLVLPNLSDEEIAALNGAGTVITEPYVVVPNGRPGAAAFSFDGDDDGKAAAAAGVNCFASVLPNDDFSVQVDFWSYDTRPQAPEAEMSLRALLRVAESQTVFLARVGEDGAILNPVYLLTASVLED